MTDGCSEAARTNAETKKGSRSAPPKSWADYSRDASSDDEAKPVAVAPVRNVVRRSSRIRSENPRLSNPDFICVPHANSRRLPLQETIPAPPQPTAGENMDTPVAPKSTVRAPGKENIPPANAGQYENKSGQPRKSVSWNLPAFLLPTPAPMRTPAPRQEIHSAKPMQQAPILIIGGSRADAAAQPASLPSALDLQELTRQMQAAMTALQEEKNKLAEATRTITTLEHKLEAQEWAMTSMAKAQHGPNTAPLPAPGTKHPRPAATNGSPAPPSSVRAKSDNGQATTRPASPHHVQPTTTPAPKAQERPTSPPLRLQQAQPLKEPSKEDIIPAVKQRIFGSSAKPPSTTNNGAGPGPATMAARAAAAGISMPGPNSGLLSYKAAVSSEIRDPALDDTLATIKRILHEEEAAAEADMPYLSRLDVQRKILEYNAEDHKRRMVEDHARRLTEITDAALARQLAATEERAVGKPNNSAVETSSEATGAGAASFADLMKRLASLEGKMASSDTRRSNGGARSSTDDSSDDGFNRVRRMGNHNEVDCSKIKVPQPGKYTGDDKDNVDDAIFTLENYLSGNRIPRADWPSVAMPLLSGKALSTWIAFAQPMHRANQTPTWDQFVDTLTQAFGKPDRQLAARQQLLDIRQIGSVQEYLQRMRMLITRAGSPKSSDYDLMLLYWNGLKPEVRESAKVNPQTGKFWENFQSLTEHTLLIDLQRMSHHGRKNTWPPRHPKDSRRHTLNATKISKKRSADTQVEGRKKKSRDGGDDKHRDHRPRHEKQQERREKYNKERNSHDGSRGGGRGGRGGRYHTPPDACAICGGTGNRHYSGYKCSAN